MFFNHETCKFIGEQLNATNGYGIVIGLLGSWGIAVFFGWFFVKHSIGYLQNRAKVDFEREKNEYPTLKDRWSYWVSEVKSSKPNVWLGLFEITLFYICLLVNKPEGIGGWLVFKVAAKWESWTNIIKFPEEIKEANDFEYLKLRNELATNVLQRFVIGTIMNILIAFVGMATFFSIRIAMLTENLIQKFWPLEAIGIVTVLVGMYKFKKYIIDKLPKN